MGEEQGQQDVQRTEDLSIWTTLRPLQATATISKTAAGSLPDPAYGVSNLRPRQSHNSTSTCEDNIALKQQPELIYYRSSILGIRHPSPTAIAQTEFHCCCSEVSVPRSAKRLHRAPSMGGSVSRILSVLWSKKEIRILILGLVGVRG